MFSCDLPSSNAILFHPILMLFGRKFNLLDEKILFLRAMSQAGMLACTFMIIESLLSIIWRLPQGSIRSAALQL
jgi:hypothetical protein